jgi:hypothetical protein
MRLPRISLDGQWPRGKGRHAMRVLENNYGWNPIETAPLDKGVTLEVTDGRGTRCRLPNPCRRTASAWVSSRAEYDCAESNNHVVVGKEYYFLSGDGYLMPTRKDQPPPDPRYFKAAK